MNCAKCRDNLVACLEGLLDGEEWRRCQAHLDTCAKCGAEYAALGHLHEQLVVRSSATRQVSLVASVMRRVRQVTILIHSMGIPSARPGSWKAP